MALTIAVKFLTGCCVAARSKTDPEPEWPPHPARLYMALAAAWFESDRDERELAALRWLESLAPPALAFSEHATPCPAVGTYVPANDSDAVGRGGLIQTLPTLKRHRAERMFPRTRLPFEDGEDVVRFSWADADNEHHIAALAELCARVGRLGHSTSLVQVWVERSADRPPRLVHDDRRPLLRMRTVSRTEGTMDRLAELYERPPHRPSISQSAGYRYAEDTSDGLTEHSVFDPRLEIFRLASADGAFRWLDIASTLQLTAGLRRAIQANIQELGETLPESIGGHQADGRATERPHVAYMPIPAVGHKHGDGHLLGFAVVLPRERSEADPHGMPAEDTRVLMRALERLVDRGLVLGRLGRWSIEEDNDLHPRGAMLRSDTWSAAGKGATHWASVTPVVFDEHPKSRSKRAYLEEAEGLIRRMFVRIGLPEPLRVALSPVSVFAGSPPAFQFPRLARKDGSERRHIHVSVRFDREVVGPILIGAGRYRGYGLLKPVYGGGSDE